VATALAAAPLAAVVQTPLRARRVPRAPLAPTDDLVNA
jgi:hypothetical protein